MTSFNWPTTSSGVGTYSTFSAFPVSAPDGTLALALDTDVLYAYNSGASSWVTIGGPGTVLSVGTIDTGTPSANGAQILLDTIIMQSASATKPGLVNLTTQTFAGNKTFSGTISASNLSGTNTGDVTLAAVGSTPSANAASLSGQALTLQPADGTHPGVVTALTQSFGGNKTFTGTISASNLSGTNTGDVTLGTANGLSLSGQVLSLPNPTKTLYVDNNRTDTYTANGSFGFPFKTIQAAISQVITNADNVVTYPYLIEIAAGYYPETITLQNAALVNLVFDGQNSVSVDGILSTTANDNLQQLAFFGISCVTNANSVDLVGASNNTNFLVSGVEFSNCAFSNSIVLTNLGSFAFLESGVLGNLTLTNLAFGAFSSGIVLGSIGTTTALVTNGGDTPVYWTGSTILVLEDTVAPCVFSCDAGSILQFRIGSRVGSPGIALTCNGSVTAYNSFIRSNIIINSGGSFVSNGSFWGGSLTTNPGGTFTNNTASTQIAYTPTTSANWATVPTQAGQSLDLLSVSGIAKTQTANTTLSGPTSGGAALPTFRSLVAADIPSLPYASSTLNSAHLFVGNVSNVATDVAVSGDVTLANTGAFTIANLAVTNAKIANTTIDLTAKVTGTLPVANGGIGVTTASANTVFSGPTSGGATAPAFRALTVADETIAAQAISASAIDWSTGNVFTKTLSSSITVTFSNAISGQTIVVRLTNTASNWTVTWPTVRWPGGAQPTMTTGAFSDVYTFVYDGSNFYGSAVQNMS